MNGYPIIFDLSDRLCVVVGAGNVGCRKVRGLLAAEAVVRLISITEPVDASLTNQVDLHIKAFEPTDLNDAVLAFAATNSDRVNHEICLAAKERGIPVNTATHSANGDFRLPAVLRRGDLLLTVATSGRSPALARIVRDQLAKEFGPEWAYIVEILGQLRTRKLTNTCEKTYFCEALDRLLDAGLVDLVAAGRTTEINNLLTRVLGETLSPEDLGLILRDVSS